jgi:hypothetical protein
VCLLPTVAVHLTEIQSKGEPFAINVVNELKDPYMWLSTSVVCSEELDHEAAFTPLSALAWNLSKWYKLCRWYIVCHPMSYLTEQLLPSPIRGEEPSGDLLVSLALFFSNL